MAARLAARGTAGALSAAISAALVMAVAGLKPDEGKRNVDYLDIARVPTACYGHTGTDVKVGRRRTDPECEALLNADVRAHMNDVLACSPGLADRPFQLAAATRLSFNAGVGGYCSTRSPKSRSAIARSFGRGAWRAGCDGFLLWDKARVNGRLVQVRGLTLRRQRERAQCLTGVA